MRRKNKLNFSSERQTKAKRTRAFVLSFAAFILVFGSVSLLIFMKSLDFDLQNLVKKPDAPSATAESTAEETVPIKLSDTNVLLVCSDGNKHISLLSLFCAHAESETVTVSVIDPTSTFQSDSSAPQDFQSVFESQGLAGLKKAVTAVYALPVHRYIQVTESNLKKAIGSMGDISLNVPQAIQYRGTDYSLYLDGGEQRLTGDLFIKYLNYTDLNGKSEAACALVKTVLFSFGENNREKLFNTLFNLSDTDFSVVDCTDSSGAVNVFLHIRDHVQTVTLAASKES